MAGDTRPAHGQRPRPIVQRTLRAPAVVCASAAAAGLVFFQPFAAAVFTLAEAARLGLPMAGARRVGRPRNLALAADPWPNLNIGNPLDMLKGSMVDPGYWKQQQYLQIRLRQLLPRKLERLTVLQLEPDAAKHVGYICGDKDVHVDSYYVLAKAEEMTDDMKSQLEALGKVHNTGVVIGRWQPEEQSKAVVRADRESMKGIADMALIADGSAVRLQPKLFGIGLAAVCNALNRDGFLVLVLNEQDERLLGGSLEAVLESQDQEELARLTEVSFASGGRTLLEQVLRDASLRLMQVVRDECGLVIGICAPVQKQPQVSAAQGRPKSATSARRDAGKRSKPSVRRMKKR